MIITIPIRIESTPNLREHWAKRANRNREHRGTIAWMLYGKELPKPPCAVTLTRIAPKRTLDTDNLAAGFKAVRDEIAVWLGADDADPRIEWRYQQRKGKPKEYAAEVEIVAVEQAIQAMEQP